MFYHLQKLRKRQLFETREKKREVIISAGALVPELKRRNRARNEVFIVYGATGGRCVFGAKARSA